MINKKLLLILTLLISNNIIYSQLLSINETADYLTELSKKYPSTPSQAGNCKMAHYEQFSVDNDGTIKIQEYRKFYACTNGKRESSHLVRTKSIHIEEVDINKIQIQNKYGTERIIIPCVKGNCVLMDDTGKYNSNLLDKDKLVFYGRTNHILSKKHNALLYLLQSVKVSDKYFRGDSNDPFAPQNFKDTRYRVESKDTKTVVNLSENQGVFELLVYFGNGELKDKFVLDSGASELSITPYLEREMIKLGLIKRNNYLSPGLYQIADGSIISARRLKIPKLKVGSFTVYNVTASVGTQNSPLLLGRSFFDKFSQWSIDNAKNKLILVK